jgi:DNA-binding response OmpR family regulator
MTADPITVLLVDDDKFLLDMYAMKFTAEGFAVQACLSARDALAILKEGSFSPQAILFDLTMPECDGYEFLQRLSQEHLGEQSMKFALTNQSSDEEKKKATALGADQFLVKATMIPSEVVNTVRTALSRGKSA